MSPEEFNSIRESSRYLLVDFYADWCEPCKMLDEILVEVSSSLKEHIKIIKVDIDASEEIRHEFVIQSIPTLIFFKDGILLWRMPGFMMAPELVKKIKEYI